MLQSILFSLLQMPAQSDEAQYLRFFCLCSYR
jgi:hypothetical protein